MDLKKLMTTMGILGLLVFSVMAFIVTTQNENSVLFPITNHSLINSTYESLSGNLSSSEDKTATASANFGNITPTQQFGELEVTSIISPTRIMKTIIVGFWNIFIKLPQAILGVDPLVASLISSLILVFIIIGIWAIWKGVIS